MQRAITIEWQDPQALAGEARRMAGIEFLRAIRDGRLPAPPIANLLGMRLIEVAEGEAAFELTPGEQHYNPIGVVHGGIAATLLDSAMGCAVHSLMPAGAGYTTLEMKINLVRAVTTDAGSLRAAAKVIHAGARVATAEGRLTDAAGRLYAHASTTCMVLRER